MSIFTLRRFEHSKQNFTRLSLVLHKNFILTGVKNVSLFFKLIKKINVTGILLLATTINNFYGFKTL